MKRFISSILLLFWFFTGMANNPYRNYLLARVTEPPMSAAYTHQSLATLIAPIPRYQICKGAVFCRMEDKVTRATKVWLKLGVE
jgi:hypothetical protein